MVQNKPSDVCALCGRNNQKLRQSHIIPELVYKRVKYYKTSRFRNFLNLNQIFQNGQKKPLLCSNCEMFFSGFEVKFTNFFDEYLHSRTQSLPPQNKYVHDYIISVSWRILYDELFILNSFKDDSTRYTYEFLEKRLRNYLNQIRTDDVSIVKEARTYQEPQCFGEMVAACEEIQNASAPENLEHINTYIFTLKDLGYSDKVIDTLKSFIWGYACNSNDQKLYVIYSCYAGLITATVFWNNRTFMIPDGFKDILRIKNHKKTIKGFLISEINYQIKQINSNIPNYKDFLNKNKDKLIKRYQNSQKRR